MFTFIIICPGLFSPSLSFLHLCFTPSLFSSLHYVLLPGWPIKYLTPRFVVLFSLRNILDQRCMALCLAPLLRDNYCGVSSYLLHTPFLSFFFSFLHSLRLRPGHASEGMRQAAPLCTFQMSQKLHCDTTLRVPFFRFLSCCWFFAGRLNAAVDQFSGSDEGMGEMGDNACVECLAMKCVGAEHRQWRAPFHYL